MTNVNTPPLLQVRQISKQFPGVKALDHVSLTLHNGEVLAIIGENGAGKSTLMKILAGIYTPNGGTIVLDGQNVRMDNVKDAMRCGISLIHQELNLAENLSAAANIFLGRERHFAGVLGLLRNREMASEAEKLMERVGLDCSPQTIVGKLTPGRRQLVEIARALSLQVRILIMDEPTSSLTQRETEKLYAVIDDLRHEGVSILYISHRLAEVERIADRVVVLRDGKNAGELFRSTDFEPQPDTAIREFSAKRHPRPETKDVPAEALISHEAMVRLMVGRDLSQFFQRQHAPGGMGRIRLELRKLRYGGVPGVPSGLSAPVSLTIHAGEIVGMAGLVGAGRTELAEAIFGLRAVHSGEIFLDGQPVHFRSPRRAIAAGVLLVPEDRRYHGLILQDSVEHNLSLPNLDQISSVHMVARKKEHNLAERMRQRLHVRCATVGQTVGLLSGGNQQKVVLGKWLARQPRVLIVDEPTRGVDVGAKSEIYALLDQLAGQGVAILMISSDLEEILGMSDRVAVMHEGRMAGIVPREMLSEEAVMHLATGGENTA